MTVFVCLSVRDYIFETTHLHKFFFYAHYRQSMARSSSGGVEICCILPALWMTSRLYTQWPEIGDDSIGSGMDLSPWRILKTDPPGAAPDRGGV